MGAARVSEPRIAGILLAAGASHRLGTAKQLLPDAEGTAFVVRAARQLLDAGCAPVVVVTGAHHEAVGAAVRDLPVTTLYNRQWSEGMASSIRCAIDHVSAAASPERSTDAPLQAVLIAACDMPSVTTDHLRNLIAQSPHGQQRVASRYATPGGDVRGIPAIVPAANWPDLQRLTGDRGARALFHAPDTRTVVLEDGSVDIDTPDDLTRWRSRHNQQAPPRPDETM